MERPTGSFFPRPLGMVFLILLMAAPARSADTPAPPLSRTRAEVEALVAEAGRTPPSWFASTPLRYPPGLDLTFQPGKPWNNQKFISQYLWDIIYPNPGRWPEGAKLLHHALLANRDNPEGLSRALDALARIYAELLQDYPRGAFWARKHGGDPILLANCYWKMGSKEMAQEILQKIGNDDTGSGMVIKLWADMGELDTALRLAETMAADGAPDTAYLAAGDACRLAGQYPRAIAYYQKVLASQINDGLAKRNRARAQASLEAIKLFDALDLGRIPDGAYTGRSIAYTGPLEVSVTVKNARIESVKVTRHTEKQFYASIDDTTRKIVEKQGVKGVDATSAATITSEAIINATAKALAR